jgi:hypothetical protein
MLFEKKVESEAVLESKEIVSDYATDVENYGSKYAIFAVAEKSQSFRKIIKEYVLVFKIADKQKMFKVSKNVFDRNYEGTAGILTYTRDNLIDFKVNKS